MEAQPTTPREPNPMPWTDATVTTPQAADHRPAPSTTADTPTPRRRRRFFAPLMM